MPRDLYYSTVTFRPLLVSISGFIMAGLLGAVAVMALNGAFPGLDHTLGWLLVAFSLVSFGSAIFSVFMARGRSRTTARLRSAATEHGFGFIRTLDGPGFSGLLFRTGTRVHAHDLVDTRTSPTPFLAGSLTGQYANDTSTPRIIGASFIIIPLPKSVPNIVLIAQGLGTLRQAGLSLAGRQKLSLEGDFGRNFTLYCPEGYERDALYIFAPDLMQLLIETTAGCDVEFVDDSMYVYSAPGRYRDATAIENLVRVAERVQEKLRRQTTRYADDRSVAFTSSGSSTVSAPGIAAAPRTVSPEDHATQAGKVARGGQRIRTKTTVLQKLVTFGTTVLLAVAVIYTAIYYLPTLLHR